MFVDLAEPGDAQCATTYNMLLDTDAQDASYLQRVGLPASIVR